MQFKRLIALSFAAMMACATALAQPAINGEIEIAEYQRIGTTNSNDGFGTNDVHAIWYRAANDTLYLAVQCRLTSGNGLAVFLNFSGYGGRPPLSNVGGSLLSSGHPPNGILASSNNNVLIATIDVDYAIWFNLSGSTIFFDFARYNTTSVVTNQFIGSASTTGTASTGPSVNNPDFMQANKVTFAYQESTGLLDLKGFEMKIPLSEIPGVDASQTASFFAIIGNAGNPTFWSNEAVPGISATGNLGQNPTFPLNPTPTGGAFTTPQQLPVELTSFNAQVLNNGVRLSWTTATETNNAGFEVQRSADQTAWTTLGFVRGAGTTTEAQSYSFADAQATGRVFYRLKQVDFDGQFEYSNVIEVNAGLPKAFALEQNYPNPFNPSTMISYQLPASSNVSLKVFDMLGKEVATLVNARQEAGAYTVNFNANQLSSGVYFYRLQAGNFVATKKMMLVK